jgi:hypothetical protein
MFRLGSSEDGWHGQTRLPVGLRMGESIRDSTVKELPHARFCVWEPIQVWRCRPAVQRVKAGRVQELVIPC